MDATLIFKLVLALALGGTICAGMIVPAPRRSFPRADLRIVVLAAFGLYAIGLLASLSHHITVAMLVFVAGIGFSTFAAWLSRGHDSWEPPRGQSPDQWPPPGGPDEPLGIDWDELERQLGVYAERREHRPALTR